MAHKGEEIYPPNVNVDWRANAQAHAAALNVVWEYVSGLTGKVRAQEHLPSCGMDPLVVAEDIVRALVEFEETLPKDVDGCTMTP